MPRTAGDKEYILPFSGLNTEVNLLHFPQEFAVDVLNMVTDYNPQMVRPRKGVSTTGSVTLVETRNASAHDVAINSFLWENVNDDPDKNFIVIQVGGYLYFLDDTTYVANTERVDLNDVLSGTVEGTLALLEPTRVEFTNVKGNLMACANAINPTLLRYTGTAIEATEVILQQRDLLGIDDGLEVDERPTTGTVTDDEDAFTLFFEPAGIGFDGDVDAGDNDVDCVIIATKSDNNPAPVMKAIVEAANSHPNSDGFITIFDSVTGQSVHSDIEGVTTARTAND